LLSREHDARVLAVGALRNVLVGGVGVYPGGDCPARRLTGTRVASVSNSSSPPPSSSGSLLQPMVAALTVCCECASPPAFLGAFAAAS